MMVGLGLVVVGLLLVRVVVCCFVISEWVVGWGGWLWVLLFGVWCLGLFI